MKRILKKITMKSVKKHRTYISRRHINRSAIALSVFGALMLSGCGRTEYYTSVDTAMGTIIRQSIYSADGDLTDDVKEIIDSLENDTLSWRIAESEIAQINALAGSENAVDLSEKLKEDLITCLDVSEKSNGAFDITIGELAKLWNIDEWAAGRASEAQLPKQETVEAALLASGYEKITLNDGKISFPENISLNLGAVGKGIACDEIAEYLTQKKASGAVICVGGSILTYGRKPDGTPWSVGIVNPKNTAEVLGILSLNGQWCVSTSGDYERYVMVDGVRYHHILDPQTGYPADSGLSSVTILCKSGILSDALSTACFVLGKEEGMKLAEAYGVEALFVDKTGEIFMTEGMKKIFALQK